LRIRSCLGLDGCGCGSEKLIDFLDDFSSARHFKGWPYFKKIGALLDEQLESYIKHPLPDYLSEPKSWLAQVGWTKAA
jgi:hypothetical protein